MPISDYLLYRLAKNYPSPKANEIRLFGSQPGTDAYAMAYADNQFKGKLRRGIPIDIVDKEILEIGCGHGGISCYLALFGTRVTAIDLNTKHLEYAQEYKEQVEARYGPTFRLPVSFHEMNAYCMGFADSSFDIVMADNVFEHFVDPGAAFREAFRVLRPGGQLIVPTFSSIFSKYGLHLKHGLKLPWANIIFSEQTIIRAMYRLAEENPRLYELYPGLAGNPRYVRDLRPYRDLNDITYAKFKELAQETGFRIGHFTSNPVTVLGLILVRIPYLRNTIVMDVLSKSASAQLMKPD